MWRIHDEREIYFSGYFEGLGEIGLEAVEVGLEDLGLGEVIDEFAVFFGADEACGLELFHVVGEGGGGDVDAVAHAAAGGGAALGADFLEDLVAARVGEGSGDELDLVFGELYGLFQQAHRYWMVAATARRKCLACQVKFGDFEVAGLSYFEVAGGALDYENGDIGAF